MQRDLIAIDKAIEVKKLSECSTTATRRTNVNEKLLDSERKVLEAFLPEVETFQTIANEKGVPVYARYMYKRGNPERGRFEEIMLRREPGLSAQVTTLITEEETRMGPIFCVYPSNVKEIYHERKNRKVAVGLQTEAGAPLWFPQNIPEEFEESEEGVIVGRPMPPGAVVDDMSVNLFLTQLYKNIGDEEIRPFLCACRDGAMTIVTPGISTIGRIRNTFEKGGSDIMKYFSLRGLQLSLWDEVSPADTMKSNVARLGQTLGMSVFDIASDGQEGTEFLVKDDRRAKQKILSSHEQEIQDEVHEAFRVARVPKNSVVVGNLVELLTSVGVLVQSLGDETLPINVTPEQFGAVLKAVKSYGLDFLGMTLPYIQKFESKVTPALEAKFAGLPYPLLRYVANRPDGSQYEDVINDGVFLGLDYTQFGTFAHRSGTSTKQGIIIDRNVNPLEFTPPKEGKWAVMPLLQLGDTENRFWFHPELGILWAQDRVIPNRNARLEELVGNAHIEQAKTVELTPEEKAAFEEFIKTMDYEALTRVIGDTEWALEFSDKIRRLYEKAGVVPTLGLFGYDIVWIQEDIRTQVGANPLLQRGVPFVSEMHDNFEGMDRAELARALLGAIKRKYKNRSLVVPCIGYSLMHELFGDVLKQNINGTNQSKSTALELDKVYMPKEGGTSNSKYTDVHHSRRQSLEEYEDFLKKGRGSLRKAGIF